MKIDIESEQLISLAELARKLPRRRDRPVHLSTLHRWRTVGVSGGIRLVAIRVGGTWYTTWPAFRQFCDRVTAAKEGSASSNSEAQRRPETNAIAILDESNW